QDVHPEADQVVVSCNTLAFCLRVIRRRGKGCPGEQIFRRLALRALPED
ncbi:hypothetical protein EVAR_101134_1, partial [Eumeta japonica]